MLSGNPTRGADNGAVGLRNRRTIQPVPDSDLVSEAAGTNHGSIEWYAFADESGGLAYTLLMDERTP
jgi:hypothetical protein